SRTSSTAGRRPPPPGPSRASTASTPTSSAARRTRPGSRWSSRGSAATSCSAATPPSPTCRKPGGWRVGAGTPPASGPPGQRSPAGCSEAGGSLAGSSSLRRALSLPEELPELLGEEQPAAALAGYDPIADTAKVLCGGGGEEAIDGHRRPDPWLAVHLMESAQYLRNQLLRDSDWASMAHSVELRVPFVDARLRASLAAGGFDPARG